MNPSFLTASYHIFCPSSRSLKSDIKKTEMRRTFLKEMWSRISRLMRNSITSKYYSINQPHLILSDKRLIIVKDKYLEEIISIQGIAK